MLQREVWEDPGGQLPCDSHSNVLVPAAVVFCICSNTVFCSLQCFNCYIVTTEWSVVHPSELNPAYCWESLMTLNPVAYFGKQAFFNCFYIYNLLITQSSLFTVTMSQINELADFSLYGNPSHILICITTFLSFIHFPNSLCNPDLFTLPKESSLCSIRTLRVSSGPSWEWIWGAISIPQKLREKNYIFLIVFSCQ